MTDKIYNCLVCAKPITQPLARQKMYRHLLSHDVYEGMAMKLANEIPTLAEEREADLGR